MSENRDHMAPTGSSSSARRLRQLLGALSPPSDADAGIAAVLRPSPTVTSFRDPHVGDPLLPGYLSVSTPVAPPAWATQMTHLLRQQTIACEAFFNYYFDEHDGQMEMFPRWGGNDGPDDAIENLTHWPVLYALGGGDSLQDMCNRAWE